MAKRTFGREFKLQVTRQLVRGEKRLAQICREYGLCQTLVLRWREQYEAAGENAWLNQQEMTAGMIPRRHSEKESRAPSPTTATSQAASSPRPPP